MHEFKFHNLLFGLILIISLSFFWQAPYFITGDGPCHIQNAIALKDLLQKGENSFYASFYHINTSLSPNLFSHLLMLALLFFFKPLIVEKIILSLCVAVLALGFKYLATSIKSKPSPFVYFVFPLIFQAALYRGFYNYILSIGLLCFLLGLFYRAAIVSALKRRSLIGLIIGVSILYFIHIIGFLLFLVGAGAMVVLQTGTIFLRRLEAQKWQALWLQYLIILLPGLLLLTSYVVQFGNSTHDILVHKDYLALTKQLCQLSTLFIMNAYEPLLATCTAIILLLSFGYSLILFFRKKNFSIASLSLLFLFCFSLFVYYCLSDQLLGGGLIQIRFETLSYLFLLLFCIAQDMEGRIPSVVLGAALICTLSFAWLRIAPQKKANQLLQELELASASIQDHSFVLSLSFNHKGLDQEGHEIAANEWILGPHAAQIIGLNKRLVFADNYEAKTGYFPLLWNTSVNPYTQLNKGNGFESDRPMLQLSEYNSLGHPIDYILLFNTKEADHNLAEYQQLMAQITASYTKVYQSQNAAIEVYQRQ